MLPGWSPKRLQNHDVFIYGDLEIQHNQNIKIVVYAYCRNAQTWAAPGLCFLPTEFSRKHDLNRRVNMPRTFLNFILFLTQKAQMRLKDLFSSSPFYSPKCLREILLEIGFNDEMRTTQGNKEMRQTFFHNSLYSLKYDLICRLRTTGNPAFRNFVTSQKANLL